MKLSPIAQLAKTNGRDDHAGALAYGKGVNETEICRNFAQVRTDVAHLAEQAGREAESVAVMCAVKTQSAEAIRAVIGCGARVLGHNRVQELVATGKDLRAHGLDVELHMIGPLQRNKVNHTLRWATGIQTLDRAELIERVADSLERLGGESEIARRGRTALDVMLQVNVSGEESKSGCEPAEALELATQIGARANLALTGLMTIGPNTADASAIRGAYRQLRELAEQIRASGAPGTGECTQLSMGMTNDLPEAIAEGATLVRVGRAVFGERS
nr:YggS family pyridoxal phosphate-dependent enzyme [Bowdeniella massiliensis]